MDMLGDHQRVYKNMVAHIHDMAQTAKEKISKLYIAYNTFMVGLVVSVVLLLFVVVKQMLAFVGRWQGDNDHGYAEISGNTGTVHLSR